MNENSQKTFILVSCCTNEETCSSCQYPWESHKCKNECCAQFITIIFAAVIVIFFFTLLSCEQVLLMTWDELIILRHYTRIIFTAEFITWMIHVYIVRFQKFINAAMKQKHKRSVCLQFIALFQAILITKVLQMI